MEYRLSNKGLRCGYLEVSITWIGPSVDFEWRSLRRFFERRDGVRGVSPVMENWRG